MSLRLSTTYKSIVSISLFSLAIFSGQLCAEGVKCPNESESYTFVFAGTGYVESFSELSKRRQIFNELFNEGKYLFDLRKFVALCVCAQNRLIFHGPSDGIKRTIPCKLAQEIGGVCIEFDWQEIVKKYDEFGDKAITDIFEKILIASGKDNKQVIVFIDGADELLVGIGSVARKFCDELNKELRLKHLFIFASNAAENIEGFEPAFFNKNHCAIDQLKDADHALKIGKPFPKIAPNHLLLYGVPGNGKTTLAKKIAEKTGAHCIYKNMSDLISKSPDESKANVAKVFAEAQEHIAKNNQVVNIIFDGMDIVAANAGESQIAAFSELFRQLNFIKDDACLFFTGVSDKNELPTILKVDFGNNVEKITVPDQQKRKEILQFYKKKCIGTYWNEEILDELLKNSQGFSIALLEEFVYEAAITANDCYNGIITDELARYVFYKKKSAHAAGWPKSTQNWDKWTKKGLSEYPGESEGYFFSAVGEAEPERFFDVCRRRTIDMMVHNSKTLTYGFISSETIKNRFVFYGPTGEEKSNLIRTFAQETGCVLLEFNWPEIVKEYPEKDFKCLDKFFNQVQYMSAKNKTTVALFLITGADEVINGSTIISMEFNRKLEEIKKTNPTSLFLLETNKVSLTTGNVLDGVVGKSPEEIRYLIEQLQEAGDALKSGKPLPAVECKNRLLLYGPPGNGKTTMAKKIADQAGAYYIYVNTPDLIDKFQGRTAAAIKEKFAEMREYANKNFQQVVVAFDEMDAIAAQVSSENRADILAALQVLWHELDEMRNDPRFLVIGMTNREDLHETLITRFGGNIYKIEAPDECTRRAVLQLYKKKYTGKPWNEKILKELVDETADGRINIRFLEDYVQQLCIVAKKANGGAITDGLARKVLEKMKDKQFENWTRWLTRKAQEKETWDTILRVSSLAVPVVTAAVPAIIAAPKTAATAAVLVGVGAGVGTAKMKGLI